jgi:hypothetical protein
MRSWSRLALLLSVIGFTVGCSSGGDTVLVLNLSADSNITNVTQIDVTATRPSGSPFNTKLAAQSPDGGVLTTFFQRIALPDWEGRIHVTAEGITPDQSRVGSASSDVDVKKGTAIAVYLNLARPGAGTDAGSDAGTVDGTGRDATTDGTSDASEAPDLPDGAAEDTTTDGPSDTGTAAEAASSD